MCSDMKRKNDDETSLLVELKSVEYSSTQLLFTLTTSSRLSIEVTTYTDALDRAERP